MKTVIVTGGIGSGKTAVCSYLALKGIPVYDSDLEAKSLYDKEPYIVDRLEKALALPLRNQEGALDRKFLASVIFSDEKALDKVDSIVHPEVRKDFLEWRENVGRGSEVPFVILETALIGILPSFREIADKIVLVDAPEALRIRRACVRDDASESAIASRIKAQKQCNDLSCNGMCASFVDDVIVNDGTLDELYLKVDAVFGPLWK